MTGETLFIGIDMGGTNLRFALVARSGAVVYQERTRTEIDRGLEPLLERIAGGIRTLEGEAALRSSAVGGVGIGVPGLISPDGYVHSSVNLVPLEKINLRQILAARTGYSVRILNDANAFALGESFFGGGRDFPSFLMLTLGTGVGGGLVLKRKIWTGTDGAAGEYGHATIYPDGRRCNCGNEGCLEQYASATAIAAAAAKAVAAGGATLLTEIAGGKPTAREVADAARRGDAVAAGIYAEAGRALGIAAATIANLLNIDALLLSGGVAESFDLLAGPLREELERRAFPLTAARLAVVRGELGEDAGILGSAAAAMG
jgi:glucokinase